jgi:NH3-dependent NAD+ synthetase
VANGTLRVDAKKEVPRITAFISRTVKEASANGVVIGLSGGIDSAVVGALCVQALGKSRVLGLTLPTSHTPEQDSEDARDLADLWEIRTEDIPITRGVESVVKASKVEGSRVARANVQARVRMTILYYYANSLGCLVPGTGDRSEELLGYFCYDAKTRVVTPDGPKGIDELNSGDIVFSLEPETKEMVEAKVESVHRFPYQGKLVHFKGRGADVMVTPNHRMLVQGSSSVPDSRAFFRTADQCLRFRRTLIPLPSRWAGRENLPLTTDVTFSQRHVQRTISVEIEDLMYMFGLFIGDGAAVRLRVVAQVKSGLSRSEYATMPRGSSGRFVLLSPEVSKPMMKEYEEFETDFALPDYTKDRARERLLKILTKYHIGYSLTRDVVRIPSKGIYGLFVQCGVGARNKHIPRWLLDYPSSYLHWLLRGLKDSDATHAENQNVYYTSSERLKDDFVQLCFKLGRKATVRIRGPQTSVIRGKTVRTGISYEVCFAKKPRPLQTISNERATMVDYFGEVWCPSVPPYENILVERNGRYLFSGNTKWGDGGADFLPIAHLYKTQVRQLAAYLRIPTRVVVKPSSPQLWPDHRASDELPADYDKLDLVLHQLFDLKAKPSVAAEKAGVSLGVVQRAVEMHEKSEHKRRLPPSLVGAP